MIPFRLWGGLQDQGSLPPCWGTWVETHSNHPRVGLLIRVYSHCLSCLQLWIRSLSTCHAHQCLGGGGWVTWYNWKGQVHLASIPDFWWDGPPYASLSLIFQMGCREDCVGQYIPKTRPHAQPTAATEESTLPPFITGENI